MRPPEQGREVDGLGMGLANSESRKAGPIGEVPTVVVNPAGGEYTVEGRRRGTSVWALTALVVAQDVPTADVDRRR